MHPPRSSPSRPVKVEDGLVDLHIHSNRSDGALAPSDVVELAAARGLRAVALTDHDTIAGTGEALEAGLAFGVEVIAGTEISLRWGGATFHLLGYGMRPEAPPLREALDFLAESRRARNPRMAARLRDLGVDVTWEEILAEAGDSLVGRPHFARVLLRKGVVSSIQEAFDRFLGRAAPAYVDKQRLAPAEACDVIARSGGVAVLAHPGLVERDYPGRLPAVLDEMLRLGMQGIEAFHSRHSPEQTASYLDFARRHGLVVTGGSDFHRTEEGSPDLGSGYGDLRVPYSCAVRLKRRLASAARKVAAQL